MLNLNYGPDPPPPLEADVKYVTYQDTLTPAVFTVACMFVPDIKFIG